MKDKILSEIRAALKEAENLAQNLGEDLGAYEIKGGECPHTPPKWRKDKAAVYIFTSKKGKYLKIGKANAKSKARFTSQHYGFNAPSTLAKSMCADKSYAKFGLNPENKDFVKAWMLNNLRRINIYIDIDKENPRKTALKTALIEAILHYKFEPKFEGKTE